MIRTENFLVDLIISAFNQWMPDQNFLVDLIISAFNQWMRDHGGVIVNIIIEMTRGAPTMR